MKTAKFVMCVEFKDPDTGGDVQLEIFKHQNGGVFGIDASYLEQNFEDEDNPIIVDIFEDNQNMVGVQLLD